jgi:hypothetical protein
MDEPTTQLDKTIQYLEKLEIEQQTKDNIYFVVYYQGVTFDQVKSCPTKNLDNFSVNKIFFGILEKAYSFDDIKNVDLTTDQRKELDKVSYIPYGSRYVFNEREKELLLQIIKLKDYGKDQFCSPDTQKELELENEKSEGTEKKDTEDFSCEESKTSRP